jgi:hypothetical protein
LQQLATDTVRYLISMEYGDILAQENIQERI